MPNVSFSGRRLATLSVALLVALLVGGADGCSGDVNMRSARSYIAQRDYDSAVRSLDRALEANPQNVEALALRADIRRMQADAATDTPTRLALLEQMAADVESAYRISPDHADVRTVRFNGWATAVTRGNQALTNASVEPSVAQGYFRTAARILPDSSQAHYGLGLAYLRADDAPASIAPLREAVRLAPNDVSSHIYLSRALMLSSQTTEGVSVIEAAAARFPGNEGVQAALLNAYAAAGRTDDALARYDAVIATDPDNALLRANYGTLLLRAERYDEAIVQLTRATEIAPDDASAHYNLGAAVQNKAAAMTARANESEDQATFDRIIGERNALLNQSLPHFQRARDLSAAANDAADERSACRALFQVYATLNRVDDAARVAECAGESMN